jgi:hypothetical protein
MAQHAYTPRLEHWAWLGLVVALAACTESSRPSPTAPRPTGVISGIASLTLEGPASIAPGTTARYTVTAVDADGRSADVTAEAAWATSSPEIVSIVSPGMLAAQARGDARVNVHFRNAGSQKDVVVVPDGTYRLTGRVTEAETSAVPVDAVQVEAMSDAGERLTTSTGDDGRYRLYGVAGLVRLRFSKSGYRTGDKELMVGAHETSDIELALERSRAEVAGTYLLTITAASSCQDKFSDDLRSRRYTATVTQAGPVVEARLTGASFAVSPAGRGDNFKGRVNPDGLSFHLASHAYRYYSYAQYPDIAERVNPSGFIVIDGTARVNGSGSRFSGPLQGAYQFFSWDPAWGGTATIECKGNHEFVLERIS